MHVQSNKFLCCKYQEAETEKDNFRLELDCFPSENSCFYLKPYYKHAKNENNTIKNNENFIIVMKNMYLGKIPTLGISVHPIESKINTLSHR